MIKIKIVLFSFLFAFSIQDGWGQELGEYTKEEIKEYSGKVEDQIRFLEYFLNTLGNQQTSARDKDVIIRESYKKIFIDEQVQVEDDLLSDRKVITNKDVPSYLKDVEFFFKDAAFKFKIREVKPSLKENEELFFLVSLDRTLTATGLNDEEIENTQPRFVEINLDRDSNELKIASIYTTKLSRDKELMEWWESLSFEWAKYFRGEFNVLDDSLHMDQINTISSIDSLKLSGNAFIQDLSPLHALRELKYVDISNTLVQELNPISNVTFLTYLDISDTPTDDIQFIKYSEKLEYLDISNTQVADIEELVKLTNLKHLTAVNTPLNRFGALNSFSSLESLELEGSGFSDLENIRSLKNLKELSLKGNFLINMEFLSELSQLEILNLEETNIIDLSPLSSLENLKTLYINGTEVSNLDALDSMENLEKIYADQTNISEQVADSYSRKNRSVLLIHHVETLQAWYDELPAGWKEVMEVVQPELGSKSSIEALYTLVGRDSLDLSGSEIVNLGPIEKFKKIRYLSIDETKIHDLGPLSESRTLVSLSGNNSSVTNLEALLHLRLLESLHFKETPIASIAPLKRLENLAYVDVDQTEVPKWEIQELIEVLPEAVVVFRSDELAAWWSSLDDTWSDMLSLQFELSEEPTSQELHEMTAGPKVTIEGVQIMGLAPLMAFSFLKELDIHNVPLNDISPISQLVMLQKLRISQAPFNDLSALSSLENLEFLNVSNTGIDDLRPLENLRGLKMLNASGTNVKRLNGLENFSELKELDISSSNVRSLNPIMDLLNLEKLMCFNTRIKSRQVDRFKQANPACEVRYY